MEIVELERLVKNLDGDVSRIGQILPTLATKDDLKAFATKEDLKAYATKEDLRAAIAPLATREELKAAIAPLATKAEVREENERTRRYFDAVAERLEGHIRLIAEGQGALQERFDDFRQEVTGNLARIDRRLMRLEGAR